MPPGRRPPQAPQRRRFQPDQPRRRKRKPQGPKMVDVKIQVGLISEMVRLTAEDWYKLVTWWQLNREDVVVRIPKQEHEIQIILRGSASGILRIRNENSSSPIPRADVQLNRDMIHRILVEREQQANEQE